MKSKIREYINLKIKSMNKKIILSFFAFICVQLNAQTYANQNISLVGHISPNTATIGLANADQKYSGCWGWYQASKNKEYAISGGSAGTYFIDISSPATPTVCDYVPGRNTCIWREIKTYQNYCYVVSDDNFPNRFQIIDMQYLPDSVHVILDDPFTYFFRSHTIWVDNDKLYCGSVSYFDSNNFQQFSTMRVYSLATPSAPVLIRNLEDDYAFIQHVHDMYSRNDTIYANCGNQGLYVFELTASNTFNMLGSYTGYHSGNAYNHSSFLTQNGKHLFFCDEVPSGLPMRIVDVQNLSNIVPTSTFIPYSNGPCTPHNPYLIGNNIAVTSCYQDGVIVYNISNPAAPFVAGYFDTHPQNGGNTGVWHSFPYRGNWGAYPYLPSGLIVANDMQNGVFILDPSSSYTTTTPANLPVGSVGVAENSADALISTFPNPASDKLTINYKANNKAHLQISNAVGAIVFEKTFYKEFNETVNTSLLKSGTYFIKISDADNVYVKKLIIQH